MNGQVSQPRQAFDLIRLSTSQARELVFAGNGFGDDICRITSPDCPKHVGQPDSASMGFCDGLLLNQLTGISGNDARQSQGSTDVDSDSERNPGHSQNHDRPGSLNPGDSRSAMPHSSQTRKTGRAPESLPRATLFDQTSFDTERTEPEPSPPVSTGHDTDCCKNEGDNSVGHSEQQTVDDNIRTELLEDLLCSYCAFYQKVRIDAINVAQLSDTWRISTQGRPEAHFATFPDELPKRCILAGTSEYGVCADCGAPWVRQVAKEKGQEGRHFARKNGGQNGRQDNGRAYQETTTQTIGWQPTCECNAGYCPVHSKPDKQSGHGPRHAGFNARWKANGGKQTETAGWQPTCTCSAKRVPATILDPFVGSGTTLAVAQTLGRRGIGVDLNPEYLEIARKRLESIPMPIPVDAYA